MKSKPFGAIAWKPRKIDDYFEQQRKLMKSDALADNFRVAQSTEALSPGLVRARIIEDDVRMRAALKPNKIRARSGLDC
jgi:hypothetical protein